MENRELDKFLAIHVMKWTYFETMLDGQKTYTTTKDGVHHDFLMYASNWHPTTSISDAFMVVEKMTSKPNTDFVLQYCGSYVATFGEYCGWSQEGSDAPTAPLAICLAAKKAIEGKGE